MYEDESSPDNDDDYEDCDIDDLEEGEFIEDTREITLHDLYQQAHEQLLQNGFNPKDNKRALQALFPKLLQGLGASIGNVSLETNLDDILNLDSVNLTSQQAQEILNFSKGILPKNTQFL